MWYFLYLDNTVHGYGKMRCIKYMHFFRTPHYFLFTIFAKNVMYICASIIRGYQGYNIQEYCGAPVDIKTQLVPWHDVLVSAFMLWAVRITAVDKTIETANPVRVNIHGIADNHLVPCCILNECVRVYIYYCEERTRKEAIGSSICTPWNLCSGWSC